MSTIHREPVELRAAIRIALGVVTLAAAGTTLAFTGVSGFLDLTQGVRPTVEVRSTNGELYNDVKTGGQIGLTADGACDVQSNGNAHPVESLEVTAHDWPGETASAYLEALDHFANNLPETAMSFPDGIYPQGVDYPAAWRERAISACNANLNQKIAQGMSKNQVLGKAWDLKKVPLDELRGTLVCGLAKAGGGFVEPGGIYEKDLAVSIDVRCLAIFAPISSIASKGRQQEGSSAGGGSNARDGTSSTLMHGEKATRAPAGSTVKPSAPKKTTPATTNKATTDETKRGKPATSPAPATSR